MTSILPTLIEEFHDKLLEAKNSLSRQTQFPKAENMIKVAIGIRRAGKTIFALQEVHLLLQKNIPLECILYLNFEDDRLLPMDHKAMGSLIDAFYTLFPENHDRRCFLFLDEVQNIPDWAIVVRRLFDTKNVQIYLTGSSAKLLSTEISTALRGRSLEVEVWPFSFGEFLQAHQITPPNRPFGKKSLDKLRQHLLHYFQIGGFPAVQHLSPVEHSATLQGYVETVIFRDIIERHKVTHIALLRYFINFLLKNVACPFSINKFYNDIKSQGFKAAKDTLHNYLAYVEDAFLLFAVPHFSDSIREMQTLPKKIYTVDSGLLIANTFNVASNYGKLLENLFYLDLRRQGKQVFYYKTHKGNEVDFVAKKGEEIKLYQVVWDMEDPATRAREERALAEAEEELGITGEIVDLGTYLSSHHFK